MKKKYKLKIGRLLLVIILAGFGVSLLVIGINKNIISVNAPIVNSKKYNEIPKIRFDWFIWGYQRMETCTSSRYDGSYKFSWGGRWTVHETS